ncbi:SDR family oxidoreductase [Pandoraea pnomenusa]|uniref:SDR family oxidoreductase n=1 Tax=Pandoraea pnomenusa TaxID=93220 RepID=UPI0004375FFB|nr:SDR family oxidoreductase [Pandoraea pnomenusa]AHN76063.1 NmrA family transcriptional regulator [Pandoraea pnomenusa]QDH61746.1 SDR family oxidoreductase [Pandoraea pnomenusa]
MKILVIGGTGLIGRKLVKVLNERGHEAIAASPATNVNTITGEGLDDALVGVDTVVDVANSPSFEDEAVLTFFQTSTRNLLAAETRAGVRHHVALSVVGTQRLAESGYFRAKIAQEALIDQGGIPYTIVHCTQFFEFLGSIVQSGLQGDQVQLSTAFVQPIASDDVAIAVADAALGAPVNGIVEVAGPQRMRLADLAQCYMRKIGDNRTVQADPGARYFGAVLDDDTLVPGASPRLGKIDFDTWFSRAND